MTTVSSKMLFLTRIYIVDIAIIKMRYHCNKWKRLHKVLNLAIGHGLAYACMHNINCNQNWSPWQPNNITISLWGISLNVYITGSNRQLRKFQSTYPSLEGMETSLLSHRDGPVRLHA